MKKEFILAAAAILCWSTMATVSKILLGSFSQYQLLCVSTGFAVLGLFVFNLLTGRLKRVKEYSAKQIFLMIGTGLFGNFLYYVFYYSGARLMPASTAFVVNYLWPVMSVVFACILLKEKLTARKVAALAISFAGVILVSGSGLFALDKNVLLGTLFCMLGAMSYGAFTACNKKFRFDMPLSLMFAFSASFVLSLLINLAMGAVWSVRPGQLLGLAWNGVFTMAAADVCWAMALNRGNTAKISTLAYITPFLSLVWIFIFLHEPISLMTLLGFAVIILGVLMQMKDK